MNFAPFAVTWDYRCPFARNANEHLVAGLQDGADWQVRFIPFFLDQAHVEAGEEPVWHEPEHAAALLALLAGVVVRERMADHFLDVHAGLFAARHDKGEDIREKDVVRKALRTAGLSEAEAESVFEEMAEGWPLELVRNEHEQAVSQHQVFGVPTFVSGERAAFVRLMRRPAGDAALARATVERVLRTLVDETDLNEFKRTRVER